MVLVIENLLVAGQPNLPANELGQSIPYFAPKRFVRYSRRVKVTPFCKKICDRGLSGRVYVKILQHKIPDFLGERAIDEKMVSSLSIAPAKSTPVRASNLSFCQIIAGKNLVMNHRPEEKVDFWEC